MTKEEINIKKVLKIQVLAQEKQVLLAVSIKMSVLISITNAVINGIMSLINTDPAVHIKLKSRIAHTVGEVFGMGDKNLFKHVFQSLDLDVSLDADPYAMEQLKSKFKSAERVWKNMQVKQLSEMP